MARKPTQPTPPTVALLTKPREETRARLLARVELARTFDTGNVRSETDFEQLQSEYYSWNDYNVELLRRCFSDDKYANDYSSVYGSFTLNSSFFDQVRAFEKNVGSRARVLTSIIDRLDLIDEAEDVKSAGENALVSSIKQTSIDPKRVFLVHGHDGEAKAVVARFIDGCGLQPVILHEQPNGGRTIIEKFEQSSDVGFAIVLLTPDDVGGVSSGEPGNVALRPRARQNVILELGHFTGSLGRGRVAALKKGELELPTDIAGIVWTDLDSSGAWKVSLVRELKAAGYDVDVSRALGI